MEGEEEEEEKEELDVVAARPRRALERASVHTAL